jgi:ketosteroid isomerase-like protein
MKQIVAILGIAFAQLHGSQAAPDFKRLYDAYQEAVRRMDAAAYMSMDTDDFVMVSPDGRVHDRDEMKKYQEVNAATTKKVNAFSATIEAVTRLDSGDYSVIILQQYDRDQAPMEEPNKPHNIRTSAVQREVWHNGEGTWRIRRIEELLVGPVYFDGKVIE